MKPPRAKIVKMHKLLDEALSLWPDVREWASQRPGEWANVVFLDDDLQEIVVKFRDLRHEVEKP